MASRARGSIRTVSTPRDDERVASRPVLPGVLLRIPVDQGPPEHRMRHAADFVFDAKERRTRLGVDDIDKAKLVLAAFLRHEPQVLETPVRTGKIGDVNLDVVAIVG